MATPRETLLCRYSYDALDRLTSNELPNEPEHQRFYCKSRLATEIQGANRYSVFQHGDQLLAQQQKDGGSLDTTLLTTDQQRSVLHTLNTNQPQRAIAYTPYGHRPAANGLLSLPGFNGEWLDGVTGWYFLGNGYRAFNPVLMRFNSPDSWSPFGKGGFNSYAYCLGDPVNRYDQNGHVSILRQLSRVVILGRRAQAKIVARTNTILLGSTDARHALKPGITPTQAVNARAKMNKLETLSSTSAAQDLKFLNDSTLETQRQAMQNLTDAPKVGGARYKLFNYIKSTPKENAERPFSMKRLMDAEKNVFAPGVPLEKRPYSSVAADYLVEMMLETNPYSDALQTKSVEIRTSHFTYIPRKKGG
ncbi:RHS repeat-associated core domain-containing protein [Pseudomonas sp. YuFO20]|uniref:RHS repeat-associated core domain-containing protein n=1 Tax=Pseudomonas sp. YuFO20 TaxID=3095362 RepID=UPI002B24E72C|nr:RHS repeat-associated core domain-containing protein [Pseudomonas sp. YuFO20]MEB2519109.1 RHS repeat-associated core domain-containing protein [Pseudomonas sp. YuFO20]